MGIKKSKSRILFEVCNTAILILLMIITIYPLWYVFAASFSDSGALMRNGGKLIFLPLNFNVEAYQKAFSNQSIITGYKNTLFLLLAGVSISLILSSIGAYFLSRKNVMFKNAIAFLIVFTMWFSGGLIPFYIAVRDIGLNGSIWSLIIPTAISTYNMLIMRTAFESIPDSLEESAYLDGAGHWTILLRIVLPLSKATLAVIALYYGVGYWNSWFNASIFLQGKTDQWPLQLVLRQILIANDTSAMTQGVGAGDEEKIGESIKYAVIVIATLPILCVYPFIQRYFVKGVMIGAVKG